jgi:hypothetical protein
LALISRILIAIGEERARALLAQVPAIEAAGRMGIDRGYLIKLVERNPEIRPAQCFGLSVKSKSQS